MQRQQPTHPQTSAAYATAWQLKCTTQRLTFSVFALHCLTACTLAWNTLTWNTLARNARATNTLTMKTLVLASFSLLVSGCSDYRVTLNNTDITHPTPLFHDYSIADTALHKCVEQTISDGRIQTAARLTALNCSSANISSLKGLQAFTQLKYINLDSNRLYSLAPLLVLDELETVSAENNPNMNCKDVAALRNRKVKVKHSGCNAPPSS